MLECYIVCLGLFFILLGSLELVLPLKTFSIWKKWSSHRLFFLHGILLVIAGFPLTLYNGNFSGAVFLFGCVMVLSGPFILLYPEKIAEMFDSASREMNEKSIKRLIYAESLMRIVVGLLLIVASRGFMCAL